MLNNSKKHLPREDSEPDSTSGSAFGATLIVAGTTIGAGMLALPIISYGLGFTAMALMMLVTWAMMAIAALLTLEVNLAVKPGCSLFAMAKETLQGKGGVLSIGTMLFLYYALLSAYIAGGGSQLGHYLIHAAPSLRDITDTENGILGMLVFTLLFGGIASIGIRSIDLSIRILFVLMLVTFALSLGILAPHIELPRLQTQPSSSWIMVMALPVIFTSFGYHGSIPSLIAYVGNNKSQLKRVFLIGSFVPLFVYLLWLGVSLGQLNETELNRVSDSQSVAVLIDVLSNQNGLHNLPLALHIFADLALVTSFLGVALGLFDFIHSITASRSRVKTALAVYTPPLLIALFLPGAFVIALNYAALALAMLAILLPALMVYKLIQNGTLKAFPGRWFFWPTVLFGLMVSVLSLI